MKGAIRTNLQSQMGTGPALIEWSDPDREWLFGCLTNAPGRAPLPSELEEIGNVAQLGEYLAGLPDVPSGAFDPQRDSALVAMTTVEPVPRRRVHPGRARGR